MTVAIADPRSRRAAAAAALVGSVLALAGCQSSGGSAAPSAPASAPTSAAPSPSASPDAEARQLVLAAYKGMWAEQVKAFTSGSLKDVKLETFAGDKALADIKSAAVYYQDNNLVLKGEPKLSPEITALDLTGTSHRATIRDCVDTSSFLPYDKGTGQPAQLTDTNRRHVQTSTLRIYDGRWVVMESTLSKDQTC
ncbi:hypothetical protein [Kitasatospora sp. MBT66]|uniref:hypothetical protein n=1 Tax=Kitasatospora sp. MBT66 TaxID=1444769 RepID=UPI0011EA691B|nr:hypothetical protein [Kitasatospora sp. MBT66]